MLQQITIKLDKVDFGLQARKFFDEKELRLLGENIREYGLLCPPLVKPLADRFELLAGERRVRAMRLVGISESQVLVIKDIDAGQIETLQWIENAHRTDLLPCEKAHALASIKQKKGWNNKELATHLHMDQSLPTRYLSLFDTIPPVQEAAAAGKIGPAAWYQISLLAASDQPGLLEMHLAGIPTKQVASLSRKLRKGVPAGSSVRVSRIRCPVPGKGATVVVSGAAISLGDMIEAMTDLLKLAKRESEKGIDARTFEKVCRALAKKA